MLVLNNDVSQEVAEGVVLIQERVSGRSVVCVLPLDLQFGSLREVKFRVLLLLLNVRIHIDILLFHCLTHI